MARLGPSKYTDYNETLSHIKKLGTLREYQKEFKRIAHRVRDLPEKALVGALIGGLKADLATKARVHRPKTYLDAIEVACLRDDHLSAVKCGSRTEVCRAGVNPTGSRDGGVSSTGSTGAAARPSPLWDEM